MEMFDLFLSISILFFFIIDLIWSRMIISRIEELEHIKTLYGITLQTLIDDVLELKDKVMED